MEHTHYLIIVRMDRKRVDNSNIEFWISHIFVIILVHSILKIHWSILNSSFEFEILGPDARSIITYIRIITYCLQFLFILHYLHRGINCNNPRVLEDTDSKYLSAMKSLLCRTKIISLILMPDWEAHRSLKNCSYLSDPSFFYT